MEIQAKGADEVWTDHYKPGWSQWGNLASYPGSCPPLVGPSIAVGTRGAGRPAPPPIFYPQDFINIHTYCANRCNHSVYYVQPPKMTLLPTPMH